VVAAVPAKKVWSATKIDQTGMKNKRDLLLLFKHDYVNRRSLDLELERLYEMLYDIHSYEKSLSQSYEVIDMNRFRILQKPHQVLRVLNRGELKPFIFLGSKN
jgi:hypothetical protein